MCCLDDLCRTRYNYVSAYMNKKNPPTISDVAREASVSTATVSRVLNGTSRVNADTARRVQDAITALGYSPLPAARALAGRKTHTLGLVIPEIGGAFFVPLLRGIEAAARQAGYSLLIQAGGPQSELALGAQNTDGLLVYTGALNSAVLTSLSGAGLPVIHLYALPHGANDISTVTVDNLHGANLAVEHLIKVHNRRRIAFLAGPENEPDALARLAGYRQVLERHGLRYDEALVVQGGFDQDFSEQAITDLTARRRDFDAVFAADDQSAAGALAALQKARIAVPEDVSLVGFDDVAFAAYLNPPLTTVHAPTEAVGQAAVLQLVKMIHGEPAAALTNLPTTLVVRSSCGCPRRNGTG